MEKFRNIQYFAILVVSLLFSSNSFAQEAREEQPTVAQPVVITFEPLDKEVALGQESAFVVTFKVPKYIWLGAQAGEARTPPGTKVDMEQNKNLEFGEPQFPEPSVEGVPVHVGLTRVYKGEVKVVVPYRVKENAEPGKQEITTYLTYTPGYSAGKLSTKTRQPHTTTITIVEDKQSPTASIPEPSVAPVPESFTVQPETGFGDLPNFVRPMFFTHNEGTMLSEILHTIFIDPENHGKHMKQVTYPFAASTKQEGNSFGVGMAIINSTPEGTMTGALSGFLFDNEFVGLTGGFDLITCPAAYHNVQATTRFSGGDYSEVEVQYENLLWGANDRFGIQANVNVGSDPRFLFYGIGRAQNEQDVSAYDEVQRLVIADFLYTPFSKMRFGVGFKFRNVEVGKGLNDIDGDGFDLNQKNVTRLADAIENEGRFSEDLNNIVNSTILGARFKFIYDARNQEFNPSKGFYGEFVAELNSVTDTSTPDQIASAGQGKLEDNYAQFSVDMRKYISGAGQKFSMLFRNQWTFTTEKEIPFYELASLGGPESIRAFSVNRFRDQHSMFLSAEVRYVVMQMKIMGFPMALMVSTFIDGGQTFNEDQRLSFSDDFNWAPGGSIRFVNYPNIGYIVNVATGEDGVNVTGGISLPF